MAVKPKQRDDPEAADVYAWRRDRFLHLGVDESRAADLAHSPVDWHELDRLLAAGCPLELALEIVD